MLRPQVRGSREVAATHRHDNRSIRSTSVGTQRLDQAGLGRRQQLRQHRELEAAGGAKAECGVQIDANYVATQREPQLTLAGKKHLPGFMLLAADKACSR
jgi:hypothetical protein